MRQFALLLISSCTAMLNDHLLKEIKYGYLSTEFFVVFAVILRVLPSFEAAGQAGFRGFFIQARLIANDSNVGRFQNPITNDLYRLSSCPTPTVRSILIKYTKFDLSYVLHYYNKQPLHMS